MTKDDKFAFGFFVVSFIIIFVMILLNIYYDKKQNELYEKYRSEYTVQQKKYIQDLKDGKFEIIRQGQVTCVIDGE